MLMNLCFVFSFGEQWTVRVAPGVDVALLAALCICYDEAVNQGQK